MTEPVTCIIPVHNGALTIERAVKSAIDAGCDRVLVYDDASTDNTPLALSRLEDEYFPKFHYWYVIKDVRSGVNFARNYLIWTASDSLIICLDCDDTLRSIEPLKQAYSEGTWVYGNHYEISEGDDFGKVIVGSPAGALARKELTGITFMFHKQDWLKCGGFDSDFAYCEDYAFQCNLTHHGIQPKYVDTVVYDRYLKPEGNERSALAGEYWQHYHTMARRKYPSVFANTG